MQHHIAVCVTIVTTYPYPLVFVKIYISELICTFVIQRMYVYCFFVFFKSVHVNVRKRAREEMREAVSRMKGTVPASVSY